MCWVGMTDTEHTTSRSNEEVDTMISLKNIFVRKKKKKKL